MITLEQYFGKFLNHADASPQRKQAAKTFLAAVQRLEELMVADGVVFPTNPVTGSGVSGTQYGGFRPQTCPEGSVRSSHKEGRGLDRYDPDGAIDSWCVRNQVILKSVGIYIEHPSKTAGWSHWTDRAPASGSTVFWP